MMGGGTIMTIDDELKELPTLEIVGRALAQFVRSLHPKDKSLGPVTQIYGDGRPPFTEERYPKGDFILRGKKWVYDPNFVTFTLHYTRTENITLSLRGHPSEFQQQEVLPLLPGRGAVGGVGGYTECRITAPRQLAAAAACIERAYEIWHRGSLRTPTHPVSVEQPV
jgi:hypothetical protein